MDQETKIKELEVAIESHVTLLELEGIFPYRSIPLQSWIENFYTPAQKERKVIAIHKPKLDLYAGQMGAGATLTNNNYFTSICFGSLLQWKNARYISVTLKDETEVMVFECEKTKEFKRLCEYHQHKEMNDWIVDFLKNNNCVDLGRKGGL